MQIWIQQMHLSRINRIKLICTVTRMTFTFTFLWISGAAGFNKKKFYFLVWEDQKLTANSCSTSSIIMLSCHDRRGERRPVWAHHKPLNWFTTPPQLPVLNILSGRVQKNLLQIYPCLIEELAFYSIGIWWWETNSVYSSQFPKLCISG